MSFAENDEVVEALVSDGADEALSEGIAVGAVARYADALDAIVTEHGAPRLGEERVSIVDEVSGIPQKSVTAVEEVAGHLLHPAFVRGNMDASDVHLAGLELYHEEDHVADGAEGAEGLDSEEIASVEGIPVAFEELLPGLLSRSFGGRNDTGVIEDTGNRIAGQTDLQAPKGVADLGVAPAGILVGKADDELSNVVGLARPTRRSPNGGAVVLASDQLSKPIEESLGGDDLTAGLALTRREHLALDGEASTLVVGERDTLATGDLGEDLA